jgi:hypothetical protein
MLEMKIPYEETDDVVRVTVPALTTTGLCP